MPAAPERGTCGHADPLHLEGHLRARVRGAPAVRREALLHNPSNPVTTGLWREWTATGTRIRKRLSGRGCRTHPDWWASEEPRAWNAWRREALVYQEGLQNLYAPEGLRGPRVHAVEWSPDGDVEVVLEDVAGVDGASLGADALLDVAHRLGRAQGRLALAPVPRPWWSRSFLRDHVASKHVRPELLADDGAWDHPLIRATWAPELRPAVAWLHAAREGLLGLAEAAPRTIGHLDLWGRNLIVARDGLVLLDWATAGDAALGEDLSNLLLEAALDELMPADEVAGLAEPCLAAYTAGVVSSGWGGDPRWVALGFGAAAVKWCWLAPLHLERARTGAHHRYGGATDASPEGQYRARGHALATAVGHAVRAVTLARDLGLDPAVPEPHAG